MAGDSIKLRVVESADAAALSAIYAPYVEDSAVSYEYTAPDAAEFRRRIEGILPLYPYIVAERDGCLAGYAYAHRQAERAAFEWNAELSVYLAPESCGRGIGTRLCNALMDILRAQGVRKVCALVSVPNPASVALHRALGFTLAGTWHNCGFKLGAWHDLQLYEKALVPYDAAPERGITPFCQLPCAVVERALRGNDAPAAH